MPIAIPLSLYVHFPWCVRKCPYCDFNSFAIGTHTPPIEAYIERLKADFASQKEAAANRPLQSIYIGGGTPSLMRGEDVAAILDAANDTFGLTHDCEISMEANPGTIDNARMVEFAAAGVNRLSIGIQSFEDDKLQTLGRIHGAKEAREAIEIAQKTFPNFNLDFMYGLPGQTIEELESEIDLALKARSTHLSFYELTIEDGTAFAKKPPANLPDDDTKADMQTLIETRLAERGFRRYEISGYAKEGFTCRHNMNYWTFGDYLASGAGAHGKVTRLGTKEAFEIVRFAKPVNPALYLKGEKGHEIHTAASDLPFEFMLNALRLTDGVSRTLFSERTGLSLSSIEAPLSKAIAQGLMVDDFELFRATPLGLRFLSDLQSLFLN